MIPSQRAQTVQLIATRLITDGNTVTVSHDMSGCRAAQVILNLSLEETASANNPTVRLQEGDTTDATNLTDVVTTTGVDLETARDVNIHFQPTKKLIKLSFTAGTGTGNDVMFGAVIVKDRLSAEPENTSEMVGSTHDVCKIR